MKRKRGNSLVLTQGSSIDTVAGIDGEGARLQSLLNVAGTATSTTAAATGDHGDAPPGLEIGGPAVTAVVDTHIDPMVRFDVAQPSAELAAAVANLPDDHREPESPASGRWTEREKELFLEAMEIYGRGKWKLVSRHVGTRTSVQCISHHQQVSSREAGNPVPVAQTCTVKGCSKRRISGCNGMCTAHSREAGNPVPVARTCTVKGCSKWRVSGCNGMCMAHSREAGNPVPRPVAQTCTVKGCSKWKRSGRNGMCKAHSREAGNAVPFAQTCTVFSTGAEHAKIKKSCRADECLTQSNGDGGATRGTGRSPDGR